MKQHLKEKLALTFLISALATQTFASDIIHPVKCTTDSNYDLSENPFADNAGFELIRSPQPVHFHFYYKEGRLDSFTAKTGDNGVTTTYYRNINPELINEEARLDLEDYLLLNPDMQEELKELGLSTYKYSANWSDNFVFIDSKIYLASDADVEAAVKEVPVEYPDDVETEKEKEQFRDMFLGIVKNLMRSLQVSQLYDPQTGVYFLAAGYPALGFFECTGDQLTFPE